MLSTVVILSCRRSDSPKKATVDAYEFLESLQKNCELHPWMSTQIPRQNYLETQEVSIIDAITDLCHETDRIQWSQIEPLFYPQGASCLLYNQPMRHLKHGVVGIDEPHQYEKIYEIAADSTNNVIYVLRMNGMVETWDAFTDTVRWQPIHREKFLTSS